MTFPVKWFSSAMQAAPLLSSGSAGVPHTVSPGSLIALLKAILVTGFGAQALSSAGYDSAAATITLTLPSGHAYLKDSIIEVSGANEFGFNGEFRVRSVTSTKVILGLDNGTPVAANATGTLMIKIPSLGWKVLLEDAANYKIIFEKASGTPIKLMVDNSAWSGWNAQYAFLAKVSMVEDVVDINTYTTVFEHRWPCGHSYAIPEWQAVGDSSMLYFLPAYGVGGASSTPGKTRAMFAFGDINSIRPGDQYHCLLIHNHVLATSSGQGWNANSYTYYNNAMTFGDTSHKVLARSYHQLAGAVPVFWRGLNTRIGEGMSFPNLADNGFYVSTEPVPVFDNLSYRGSLPGVVVPYASPLSYDQTHLDNLASLPNKLIRLLLCNKEAYAGNNDDYRRLIGFDIKGPWR